MLAGRNVSKFSSYVTGKQVRISVKVDSDADLGMNQVGSPLSVGKPRLLRDAT